VTTDILDASLGHDSASGGPPADPSASTTRVKDLTPGLQDWCLRARILARGSPRRWENLQTGGRLVELFLVDIIGDVVRATIFNEGVDKFDSVLKSGASYSFAKGRVKPAFHSPSRFELVFNEDTEVIELPDGAFSGLPALIPCKQIADLATLPKHSITSVFVVVLKVGASKRVKTKNGDEIFKRELLVADDSRVKIICTVWGFQVKLATSDFESQPLLIHDAQVSDFNGTRSLSVGSRSTLMLHPALPRSGVLVAWAASIADATVLSDLKTPLSAA
jgi:hypothetical protein